MFNKIAIFKKENKALLFQIILAVAILVFLILIIPQLINSIAVSKEVSEKKKVLSDIEEGINNFQTFEHQLKILEDAYADFMGRLPPQKEFPVFLEGLSKLAKENNIKIIAMEPQEAKDDPNLFYVKIPVFIDAYCGYHSLGKFINDVEYSNKFMKIDTVKIENDPQDPKMHQVLLTVATFCLRDKKDEKAVY